MTTDTAASLLRAILDDPDDDVVRLVYADHLEDQGETDRAEFIRVQIELMRAPPGAKCGRTRSIPTCSDPTCRWCWLKSRHAELCFLYVANCGTWSREFVEKILGDNWLQVSAHWQWSWTRGFVDEVVCSLDDWLTHGDAILAANPVQKVRFNHPISLGVIGYDFANLNAHFLRDPDVVHSISELGITQSSPVAKDAIAMLAHRHRPRRVIFEFPPEGNQ